MALWVAAVAQRAAQQGSGAELLKLRFLKLVGATMYLIIGGGCANPQSPHFNRWAARWLKDQIWSEIGQVYPGEISYPEGQQ